MICELIAIQLEIIVSKRQHMSTQDSPSVPTAPVVSTAPCVAIVMIDHANNWTDVEWKSSIEDAIEHILKENPIQVQDSILFHEHERLFDDNTFKPKSLEQLKLWLRDQPVTFYWYERSPVTYQVFASKIELAKWQVKQKLQGLLNVLSSDKAIVDVAQSIDTCWEKAVKNGDA